MPTLIDGREVASDSQEWRQECLARYVLTRPDGTRADWLADYAKRHGQAEAQRLAALVRDVREARIEKARAAQAELRARVTTFRASKEAA